MKSSRNLTLSELRVGIIIIIALVLSAITILQLGGTSFFTRTNTYYVRLDNSYGLKVGGSVRLAGLDVGNVADISFPTEPGDKQIIVKLEVDQKYQDRIRKDSVASVRTIGLLGDKYLAISVGSPEQEVMPDKGLLKAEGEEALSSVLSGATSGLGGLNAVLTEMRTILDGINKGEGSAGLFVKDPGLYNQLTQSATEIEKAAHQLREGRGSLGKFFNDPELYDNLLAVSAKAREVMEKVNNGSLARLSEDKDLAQNLHEVSANLKDISVSSKSLVKNLETGSIARLSQDTELYAKIDRTAGRLDSIMGRLDNGEGSVGKLLTDKELYDNMNRFFEDADALVVDVKKNPRRYLKFSLF